MKKLSVLILSGLFAAGAFAQAATTPVEAQKQGSPKAEAAAQAKDDAKVQGVDKSAKQPEAQTAGSTVTKTSTHRRHHKARMHHAGKKAAATEQQAQDAKKL
jgi:hypothetical protein